MRALLSLSKLARRLPTSLPATRTVPPLLLRHLHSDPTPPFQAPPPFVSRIIESEESPIPSTDSEHAQPEPDPVLDEFLTRLVTALRPTLAAAFPTHTRPVLDEMLRLIAEAVLNRLPGADPAPGTVELSDDLWATVWEVSASVRDAMRRDQVRADLRNYLHSDDVKEMTRFAVDAGIRGSMLRELRFKWAREKLEEVEFYRGLDVMRAQADAAAAPAALPPPPARLSALPQRKGEVKFSMYGLDLSDPKWAEVAERTAEAEAHFVPQEAKPVEGKAKKAEEKLLAVEPRKGDPLPAMEEWKEEHLPKRVDWMALLERVKARNVELYLKVAEILLAEESFDATIRDYSKLIDLHSKANHVEDAEKLLGKMGEKGIASDILTNMTLVHMYSKAGNLEQAKQAFECIQKEGLQPDNKLFTSMISACINAGKLKEAEDLVKEMNSLSIKPSREIYMDVMRAYAERGLEDGVSRMKHAMTFAGLPPTLECFSLLIEVYGQTGHSDKARGMFEQLKMNGHEPDDRCLAGMLTAHMKKNQLDEALQLLLSLEKEGIKPGAKTNLVLLDWLSMLQLVQEAEQLVQKIKKAGEEPIEMHVYLAGMYAKSHQEEKARRSLKVLEEKKKLLKAAHFKRITGDLVKGGFLEDANKYFKMMKSRGFVPSEELEGEITAKVRRRSAD
ncbi:pentatricopeptide repeat-containing protein At1g01970 [Lolium rigidum]|uniref:pentatricopeptide repeat-containing protein At1g01970 n=1 Tax=Lolium rigidum TaxID=89674 RepID=UPI001F5DC3FC|nr:pentatricopeptide repeat-containing protein At1g01970 [Lolium rigidum]